MSAEREVTNLGALVALLPEEEQLKVSVFFGKCEREFDKVSAEELDSKFEEKKDTLLRLFQPIFRKMQSGLVIVPFNQYLKQQKEAAELRLAEARLRSADAGLPSERHGVVEGGVPPVMRSGF